MRITNVFSGRPAYYDRNPTVALGLQYGASAIAPHTVTTRASYTVPSARKALLGMGNVVVGQDAAATTAGLCQAAIGSSIASRGSLFADMFQIAVGTFVHTSATLGHLLVAGDVASILTADANTGGTHRFDINGTGVEFDA